MLVLVPVQVAAHGHGHHHHHDYEDGFEPSGYLFGFMPYLIYNGSIILKAPPGESQLRWGGVHTVEVGTNLHLIPWLFAGIGAGYEYEHLGGAFRHSTFLSEQVGINITFGGSGTYLRIYWGPQQLYVIGGNYDCGRYQYYHHWGAIYNYGGFGLGIQFRYPSNGNTYTGPLYNGFTTSLSVVIGF